ncbi:MAG: hypothetical protein U9O97_07440 [Elusimicrobiota bacterium]|nr:hypothetical protein [Elusimicrobiota bacterium]
MKKSAVYDNFLKERNSRILAERTGGRSLKYIADKFSLSIRHVNRILKSMSENVR